MKFESNLQLNLTKTVKTNLNLTLMTLVHFCEGECFSMWLHFIVQVCLQCERDILTFWERHFIFLSC